MAARSTTKTQSRQKQAPEAERIIASVAPGESTKVASGARNGVPPSFEQIQRRAYELFEARGRAHGYDWADWYMAEHELIAAATH
jgi:hypothetical protein